MPIWYRLSTSCIHFDLVIGILGVMDGIEPFGRQKIHCNKDKIRGQANYYYSLGYHLQRKNENEFLSLDFGLKEFGVKGKTERLRYYRKFVYEKGRVESAEKEREKNFEVTEDETLQQLREAKMDREKGNKKAYIDLDSI